MRIVVDVRQTADGRLVGDLRMADSHAGRPFEGIIELVGLIEVFLANSPSAPGMSDVETITPGSPASER